MSVSYARVTVPPRQDPVARIRLHVDPGHTSGTMPFRWPRAEEHPEPATRVVKLAELQASRG